MNYKQRLLIELLEIKERILKLDYYLENNEIEKVEKELMEKQMCAMIDYSLALRERLILILEK